MKFILAVIAFALFIVCPRMAGITSLIAKITRVNLIALSVIGCIVAMPLVTLMTIIYQRFGLMLALISAVLTDFLSAIVMKEISLKAGIGTIITSAFVFLGVRIASIISKML